jgi:Piwi domain
VRRFARELILQGKGTYPGFQRMFRVEFPAQTVIDHVPVDYPAGLSPVEAVPAYLEAVRRWQEQPDRIDPELAIVIIPHSSHWEVERPYYEVKAALARLGWSIANIALQSFVKLGGVPWVLDAAGATELVLGIGRADVKTADGRRRIFGYAVSFVSNGIYRHTWSFVPAADEDSYLSALEDTIVAALQDPQDLDQEPTRVVFHLAKRTGTREIEAARRALATAGREDLPAAFIRVDDTTLYELLDIDEETFAAPRGLLVRLGRRRMLIQTEGPSRLSPPRGAILVELDSRSDVGDQEIPQLAHQVFQLSGVNWRGFNARAKPVTLLYGERLAELVGYLMQVDTWDPHALRSDLQRRAWFL